MIQVQTDYPVAYSSLDHILPAGTKVDNSTSLEFIGDVEEFFDHRKISVLDLGCAGGQLAVDFHRRGHTAVGLEGSDYSLSTGRANWPEFAGKVLFTCDLTKPFTVMSDGSPLQFDCITGWEVIEHIARADLKAFFGNIEKHLKLEGIFCGSISLIPSWVNGVNLHQSVFPRETWESELLPKSLTQLPYPFHHSVNADYVHDGQSFLICLKRGL